MGTNFIMFSTNGLRNCFGEHAAGEGDRSCAVTGGMQWTSMNEWGVMR